MLSIRYRHLRRASARWKGGSITYKNQHQAHHQNRPHTADAIYIRGANLVDDLIGKLSFTKMMYFQLLGTRLTPVQVKILDAVLVTLIEHGITPSAIAAKFRSANQPIPGFGHPHHKPDDPRSPRLIAVAEVAGVPGRHVRALRLLAKEVDAAWGRHLTINATGVIAALLGEIGVPQEVMRGIAVVSRAAGLVGHIREEQLDPSARHMWEVVAQAVPYAGK